MDNQGKPEPYAAARALFDEGRYSEALPAYEVMAKAGDPQCQVFLGWMYYEGLGVAPNQEIAHSWFERAASLGSKEGAFYCGKYAVARGLYEDARRWFQNAAKQEYGPALLWLGLIYERGLGVEVDSDKAIGLLRRASDAGNFPAKRELSLLMMKGRLGVIWMPVGIMFFIYSAFLILASILLGSKSDSVESLMG